MRRESTSTAHYKAVIDDLRAQRDEIDQLIASLEARIVIGGQENRYSGDARSMPAREVAAESTD
jgi:hypothetical protein